MPSSALSAEAPLLRALSRLPGGAERALREGLARAIERGTLLVVGRQAEDDPMLSLNTDAARRLAADKGLLSAEAGWEPEAVLAGQPNIYALYEENIGLVPPVLLDELEEAERLYPKVWIEAAFREAAANNRRSWRYISRILERWKLEGPDYETPGGSSSVSARGRRPTVGGPYRRVID
jgi:DNA replication protein